MTAEELLIANVTKAHNLTDVEVLALLFDKDGDGIETIKADADTILYNLEAKRVKGWKDSNTEAINRVANEKTGQINDHGNAGLKNSSGLPMI
jgi:hypothetical protein